MTVLNGVADDVNNKKDRPVGSRRPKPPKPAPAPPGALSIFHEPWWLDIAAGEGWAEVRVERGGSVLGRMPYCVGRRRPFLTSTMPPMVRTLGPWIGTSGSNPSVDLRNRLGVADELIAQLPDFVHFVQMLDPRIDEAIAFHQRGYDVSVGYTFWIERDRSKDAVWAGMRDKTRNLIRRAGEQLTVRRVDDARAFSDFYSCNLDARQLANVYDPGLMLRLIDAALTREAGCVLGAFDRDGEPAAMVVVVWDSHAAHYLLSSRKQQVHSGAVSLLVWEAIQVAVQKGLVFDFDGFAGETGLAFVTGFGGTLKPRFVVKRTRPWYAAMRAAGRRVTGRGAPPKLAKGRDSAPPAGADAAGGRS